MASIVVLGAGGVGGTLAVLLARMGHEVTVIVRQAKLSAYKKFGITLVSDLFGTLRAPLEFMADARGSPDLFIIATKAYDLENALVAEHLSSCGLVLPVVNGHEHIDLLARRFGLNNLAAGAISIEAFKEEQFRIRHSSPFVKLAIGSDTAHAGAKASSCVHLFAQADVEASLGGSMKEIAWKKLVRLNALACMTAFSGESIGQVLSVPAWRARAYALVREAVAVSCAVGVPNTPRAVVHELERLPATLVSSLARDIRAGLPNELDAIARSIVRSGHTFGIPCPTIEETVREIEMKAAVFKKG